MSSLRYAAFAFAAAVASTSIVIACSSDDTTCADCGPCGIAGPLTEDALTITEMGGGTNAEPNVRFGISAKGTCRAAAVPPKFEARLIVPPVVTPIADPTALAPLSGTKETGGTRLADGSLLKSEMVSLTVIRFLYTGVASGPSDGSTSTTTFTCTLAAGNVTCIK